jgi:serine/threonine-protein kinase
MLYESLTGQAPFSGENVNAIMYQTLNSVPSPPSSLNSAVPDMLNFIIAKALAKNIDDRYQNAKDLANDLRACRDTLPKAGVAAEYGSQTTATIAGAPANLVRMDDDFESKALPTMGLSTSFDSVGATMRLAAMTASSEEVEELSKTFKMPKPSFDEINRSSLLQSGKSGVPLNLNASRTLRAREHGNRGEFLLIIIVSLIVIGLIVALLI